MLTRNQNPAASVGVLVAITGAFAWFALVPAEHRLKSARAESETLRGEIEEQSRQIALLRQLHDEVSQLERATGGFRLRVPRDHDLGEFLKDLAAMLEQNGFARYTFQPQMAKPVTAERMTPELVRAAPGLQVQPVVVQIAGEFESLFATLRELERMPRLSQIESLVLDADPEHPGRVKVEMLINTYFLPEPGTKGD